MAILLPVLLLFVMVLLVALTFPSGLWGNLINLVNVVTAALLATSLWEPLARMLKSAMPSGVYLWDIFALWGLFAVFALVFRLATDQVSKVKLHFPKALDLAGSVFFGVWTAWVFVCFMAMSLHTAPLSREFMSGGFKAEQPMFFGLSPDRIWLGFVQKESDGAFARGAGHEFDPGGEFLFRYAERRAQFETQPGLFIQPRVAQQ
jgi:hypothetical protein